MNNKLNEQQLNEDSWNISSGRYKIIHAKLSVYVSKILATAKRAEPKTWIKYNLDAYLKTPRMWSYFHIIRRKYLAAVSNYDSCFDATRKIHEPAREDKLWLVL
jgi:hypothetical protein